MKYLWRKYLWRTFVNFHVTVALNIVEWQRASHSVHFVFTLLTDATNLLMYFAVNFHIC